MRARHRVDAEYPYLAGGGAQLGGDLADQRGLAGAVGADNAEDLPADRRERNVFVGPRSPTVPLAEIANLNRRCVGPGYWAVWIQRDHLSCY